MAERCSRRAYSVVSGFTIIELLVAASVVVVLLFATSTLLAQVTQAYRVNDEASRRQQEIQSAVEILSYDLRLAGYRGTDSGALDRAFIDPNDGGVLPGFEIGIGEASDGISDRMVVRYFEDPSRLFLGDGIGSDDREYTEVEYDVAIEDGVRVLFRTERRPGDEQVRGIVQAVDRFLVYGIMTDSGVCTPPTEGCFAPGLGFTGVYMDMIFENGGQWRFPIGVGNAGL